MTNAFVTLLIVVMAILWGSVGIGYLFGLWWGISSFICITAVIITAVAEHKRF